MSMMERRVQILLDADRHRRVTEIARQRKVSVAAVIREAIDRGLPSASPDEREAALARLFAEPGGWAPENPAEIRVLLDADRDAEADRLEST